MKSWHGRAACGKRGPQKKGGVAAISRSHYYEKCVAILSKVKPWQRARVVKALQIFVELNS